MMVGGIYIDARVQDVVEAQLPVAGVEMVEHHPCSNKVIRATLSLTLQSRSTNKDARTRPHEFRPTSARFGRNEPHISA